MKNPINNHTRKLIILLTAIALLSATATIGYAAVTYTSTHTTSATVGTSVSFTETLNGTALAQNAAIDFGTVQPGQSYTSTYTATNTGNKPITLTMTVTGLPTSWTLTFSQNNTVILPNTAATGSLILTVPASAPLGAATPWTTTITGA